MSGRWIPVPPGRRENAAAVAAAVALAGAVGAVTFWLVRTLLARESLDEPAGRREELSEQSVGSK